MQEKKDMLNLKGLHDIYGVWHKPFWQTTTFYIIVIFLLSFLVLLVIFLLIRRRLRKKNEKTAWQKALFEIDLLNQFLAQSKIQPQDFYLSLTEIVKRYLFNRYGYDLFGKTDIQVIQFLQEQRFDKVLLENLQEMSQSMELIKFAKASTAKEVMEKDIARSIELVKKTIPVIKIREKEE